MLKIHLNIQNNGIKQQKSAEIWSNNAKKSALFNKYTIKRTNYTKILDNLLKTGGEKGEISSKLPENSIFEA